MGGERDVRYATASRMVVSSASDSSLPTSAPVFLAYLPGLLISDGEAGPTICNGNITECHIAAQSPDTLTQQCEDA